MIVQWIVHVFIFYSFQARHLKLVREDIYDYDSDDENYACMMGSVSSEGHNEN